MNTNEPLSNGLDGSKNQDARGRFVKGNKAAIGRATPRQVKREKFVDIIFGTSGKDLAEVWTRVLVEAKSGEPWAVRLVLEHLVGDALQRENAERLEALERMVDTKS